jgi:hypothetical protein
VEWFESDQIAADALSLYSSSALVSHSKRSTSSTLRRSDRTAGVCDV